MRRAWWIGVLGIGCAAGDGLPPPSAPNPAPRTIARPRVRPQLVTDFRRTCQLRSDGRVRCWGESLSDWSTGPTWIAGADADAIAIDGSTLVLRDRAGRAWELPKDTRPSSMGAFVAEPDLLKIMRSCERGTCCWIDDGQVTCDRETPTGRVATRVAGPKDVTGVSVGSSHTCAATKSGEAYCWGSNNYGQLGAGAGERTSEAPRKVGLGHIADVAVGNNVTCARTDAGEIHCWGSNMFGVLGRSSGESAVPVRILGLPPAKSFALGAFHACIVAQKGDVHCWGHGTEGQLGNGSRKDQKSPVHVVGIEHASALVATMSRTCAMLDDESVRCWGSRIRGELGDGQSSEEHAAVPVEGVAGATHLCIQSEVYPARTCVVGTDRELRCWGAGSGVKRVASGVVSCDASCVVHDDGRVDCGDGPLARAPPFASTAASRTSGCGLAKNGEVTCWTNTDADGVPPTKVLGDATAVQSGSEVRCALKGAGELWCWGSIARHGSSKTPVRAAGLDDVAEVSLDDAIGIGSGVLRRKSGDVSWWYWATTSFEKGTLDLRAKPLVGVHGAVSIAGGAEDGCAALADGRVQCWGSNDYGQLGNGSAGSKKVRDPVFVRNIEDAIAVTDGSDFNCALRRSGAVSCWGRNDEGQLGRPFQKIADRPVRVRDTN